MLSWALPPPGAGDISSSPLTPPCGARKLVSLPEVSTGQAAQGMCGSMRIPGHLSLCHSGLSLSLFWRAPHEDAEAPAFHYQWGRHRARRGLSITVPRSGGGAASATPEPLGGLPLSEPALQGVLMCDTDLLCGPAGPHCPQPQFCCLGKCWPWWGHTLETRGLLQGSGQEGDPQAGHRVPPGSTSCHSLL